MVALRIEFFNKNILKKFQKGLRIEAFLVPKKINFKCSILIKIIFRIEICEIQHPILSLLIADKGQFYISTPWCVLQGSSITYFPCVVYPC